MEGKAEIRLLLEQNDTFISIKVVNYGEKIPESAIPLLFNRLYRVEESRSGKTGGAGLGLAIAKGIAELHGGEIIAASDENETVFEVRLPYQK